jgi:RHS repeat-associated protein
MTHIVSAALVLVACADPPPELDVVASPVGHTPSTPVGTIAGDLSVSAGGSARYSIPLELVPGRRGMSPELALEYDSASGNGLVGVGWSLKGLSVIARCTGPVDVFEGIPTITWTDADRLCLDGRILERVSTLDLPRFRTYPEANVEVVLLDTLDDAEGAFEARTADGLVWTYGSSAQAVVPGAGGVPRAWWVRSIRDRFGNTIEFHYAYTTRPSWYEDHRLQRITYTAWGQGDAAKPPERSVELIYEARPDVEDLLAFDRGAKTVITQRLLRIENYVGHQRSAYYKLGYTERGTTGTERSVLTELSFCDGVDVCMPPTRFSYSTTGVSRWHADWDTYPYSLDEDSEDAAIAPMVLDADLDGRRDMVVRTGSSYRLFRAKGEDAADFQPSTLFDVTENAGLRLGDFDADGRDDLLEVSSEKLVVYHAGALGLFGTMQEVGALDTDENRYLDFVVADFDGDGADDVYACVLNVPEGECQAEEDPEQCEPQPEDCTFADGEVDCDLECDVPVHCETEHTNATWRLLHPGDDWEDTEIACAEDCTIFGCERRASWLVVDHDHDGVDDLLQIEPKLLRRTIGEDPLAHFDHDDDPDTAPWDPGYAYRAIHGADGDYALVATDLPPDAFQRYNRGAAGKPKVYDVNGDGHDDVVFVEQDTSLNFLANYTACTDDPPPFTGAHAVAYLNTGAGFVREPLFGFDAWDEVCEPWKNAVALDWDGDGRVDLAFPRENDDGGADLWLARSRFPKDSEIAVVDVGEISRVDAPLVVVDAAGSGMGLAYWHGDPDEDDGSWHILYRHETPDLLVGVTDGYGTTTEVHYRPMSDPDVYLAGGSSEETRPICDARPLVSAVREPDNVLERETTYRYWNLEYDRRHRRGLGFNARISASRIGLDWIARSFTTYAKDVVDPATSQRLFAGTPAVVTTWTDLSASARQSIERTTYSHAIQTSDERTFAHVDSTTQERWEVAAVCHPEDGAGCADPASLELPFASRTHTESDFDDLGFARRIVDTDGELTTTQTIAYDHDLERWLLGLVRRVDLQSTAVGNFEHRVVEYTYYEDSGAVETMTTETAGGTEEQRSYYEYDSTGNLVLVEADARDADQRETKIEYDEAEALHPVRVSDPNGRGTTLTWDVVLGRIESVTDPNGVTTTVARDGFGRPTRQVRSAPGHMSDGADKTFTYERMDSPATPTAPSRLRVRRVTAGGADDTTELDEFGREVKRIWRGLGGEERYTTVTYDAAGRVSSQSLPAVTGLLPSAEESYVYDELGRVVEFTPTTGGTTEISYAGRNTMVTDPLGWVWQRTVDLGGRPKSVTDPYGTTVCYYSGAFGQTIGVGINAGRCLDEPPAVTPKPTKDAYVVRTHFDPFGRVDRIEDPNLGKRWYSYNGFGDLRYAVAASGSTTEYVRDKLGRVTEKIDDDGSTTWAWDDAEAGGSYGRVHTSKSPYDVEHEYVYDDFARLTHDIATVGGEEFVTSVQYDDFARPYRIAYPPGPAGTPFGTTTQFDAYGHATKIVDSATNTEYWRLVATTPDEQLAEERFGNGLIGKRTYDGGRVATITTGTNGSPTSIQNLELLYDASGNLTDRNDLLGLQYEHFDYDRVDRLWRGVETKRVGWLDIPAGDWSIVYNRLGAIESKSDVGAYTYGDPAHPLALTAAGAATHAYDDNGDLIARNGTTISYTPASLPRRFDGVVVDERRDYDALNEPVLRREDWAGGSRTAITLGDFRRITEINGLVPTTSYEYVISAGGRPVARLRREPGLGGTVTTVRYVHDDHLGSPDVMTTEGGAVAEDASFDPWGRPRNPDLTGVGSFPDPLAWSRGFTGVDAHAVDGVVWHGARPYDPVLARFLAPDPLVTAWASTQGYDRFSYVRDRPLNLTDPSGFAADGTCYGECELEGDTVQGQRPGGTPTGPDPEEAAELAEITYDQSDFLLNSYYEAPDDDLELEPYDLSSGEIVTSAVLGFTDALVEAAKAKAPMIGVSAAASNPFTVPVVPVIAGYQGYQLAKNVYADPGGAVLAMTPIPDAISLRDAIEKNNVQDAVHYSMNLAVGIAESVLGSRLVGGKCFAAGTPVHTERGLVPIEQLAPGDHVVAMDLETGAIELRAITEVFATPAQPLLRLELGDSVGPRVELDVTPTHPIWARDGWRAAGDLAVGDEVMTLAGGWLRVSSGTWIAADTVYNIEVAELHDYFVGDLGVLVHNLCPREPRTYSAKHTDPVTGDTTYTKNNYDVTYRDGYPDFSPYVRYGDDVTIELTGNRRLDEAAANAARGYKRTPDGYTWHHHQDVSSVNGKVTGRMQLVEKDVHNAFPHTGGFARAKELFSDLME